MIDKVDFFVTLSEGPEVPEDKTALLLALVDSFKFMTQLFEIEELRDYIAKGKVDVKTNKKKAKIELILSEAPFKKLVKALDKESIQYELASKILKIRE